MSQGAGAGLTHLLRVYGQPSFGMLVLKVKKSRARPWTALKQGVVRGRGRRRQVPSLRLKLFACLCWLVPPRFSTFTNLFQRPADALRRKRLSTKSEGFGGGCRAPPRVKSGWLRPQHFGVADAGNVVVAQADRRNAGAALAPLGCQRRRGGA